MLKTLEVWPNFKNYALILLGSVNIHWIFASASAAPAISAWSPWRLFIISRNDRKSEHLIKAASFRILVLFCLSNLPEVVSEAIGSLVTMDVFLMIRRKKSTFFLDAKDNTTVLELKRMIEGITKKSPTEQKLYKDETVCQYLLFRGFIFCWIIVCWWGNCWKR